MAENKADPKKEALTVGEMGRIWDQNMLVIRQRSAAASGDNPDCSRTVPKQALKPINASEAARPTSAVDSESSERDERDKRFSVATTQVGFESSDEEQESTYESTFLPTSARAYAPASSSNFEQDDTIPVSGNEASVMIPCIDGGGDRITSLIRFEPARSASSAASTLSDDDGWDTIAVLGLTNMTRRTLEDSVLTHDEMKQLSVVLSKLQADERDPEERVELDFIAISRLDKLLGTLQKGGFGMTESTLRDTVIQQAANIELLWQQRFKTQYFTIDQLRMTAMKETGALRNVDLSSTKSDAGSTWTVTKKAEIWGPQNTGDLNFQPGAWWLNMDCACRDGIVAHTTETLTSGPYGVTALALLSGTEVDGPRPGTYKYTREGSYKEMNTVLMMAKKEHPIRIIRGYKLISKYAPKVGYRYDGLHTIYTYAMLPHDDSRPAIHRCQIILKRCNQEADFNEILEIPLPSHLDDWDLYQRIISLDIRRNEGLERESNWKHWQEALMKERNIAQSQNSVSEELQKYTLRTKSDAGDDPAQSPKGSIQ